MSKAVLLGDQTHCIADYLRTQFDHFEAMALSTPPELADEADWLIINASRGFLSGDYVGLSWLQQARCEAGCVAPALIFSFVPRSKLEETSMVLAGDAPGLVFLQLPSRRNGLVEAIRKLKTMKRLAAAEMAAFFLRNGDVIATLDRYSHDIASDGLGKLIDAVETDNLPTAKRETAKHELTNTLHGRILPTCKRLKMLLGQAEALWPNDARVTNTAVQVFRDIATLKKIAMLPSDAAYGRLIELYEPLRGIQNGIVEFSDWCLESVTTPDRQTR